MITRLPEWCYHWCLSIWVGATVGIGYLAVPVLFSQLPDRALAGNLAGQLFSALAWLGLGCGSYLLAFHSSRHGLRAATRRREFQLVVGMVVLVLVGQWGIQPILAQLKLDALPAPVMSSPLSSRFAFWHGLSSALFLVQSLLGLILLARHTTEGSRESA